MIVYGETFFVENKKYRWEYIKDKYTLYEYDNICFVGEAVRVFNEEMILKLFELQEKINNEQWIQKCDRRISLDGTIAQIFRNGKWETLNETEAYISDFIFFYREGLKQQIKTEPLSP